MSFPESSDLKIAHAAEQTAALVSNIDQWLTRFVLPRAGAQESAISAADQARFSGLRRAAASLEASARYPVAAAVYGPSQVGKSLFIGQLLAPRDGNQSPLGRHADVGEPGYFSQLSFETDLNPQTGSNEATALVTRFTTNDRLPGDLPSEFPVIARALSRGQLLRVLARGFSMECAAQLNDGNSAWLTETVERLAERFPSPSIDHSWRLDLLDSYAYMQRCVPQRFTASESTLVELLLAHPLTGDGYLALASQLFWDAWRPLTALFLRVAEFLTSITSPRGEAEILLPWAAVRFILDSKRALSHERRASRCFPRVDWAEFSRSMCHEHQVLEHRAGSTAGHEPLDLIQAAMLEVMVPILPDRLHDDWRQVIENMDLLDIPGLRAGRQGAEQGKRQSAGTWDEQLEILKRGKVAYLFEHYTEEFQIQSLLLLARGGNLEVTASLKHHVDLWGQMRYGRDAWPHAVSETTPALVIGLTGIDEEFRQRRELAEPRLYDTRLAQLADALGTVMSDFGGPARPFTNVLPLRYPGTWDADGGEREREGNEKWQRAGEAFAASAMVRRHVINPPKQWLAALEPDGGMANVSALWRCATQIGMKREQLRVRLEQAQLELLELAQSWIVDPSSNRDRDARGQCAHLVLDWLTSDAQCVYQRIDALRHSLAIHEGDQYRLSDFAEQSSESRPLRPDALKGLFPAQLQAFWEDWAANSVVTRWHDHVRTHTGGGPWLGDELVGRLAEYLKDYFLAPRVFETVSQRLWRVVGLRLRDETALHEGRRRYVKLILNDLVHTPGLPVELPAGGEVDDSRLGLMAPLVRRWRYRLPQVLEAGAGKEVRIPPGNPELLKLLAPFASVGASARIACA